MNAEQSVFPAQQPPAPATKVATGAAAARAADVERLAKLEQESAASQAEITKLKTKLGLIPPGMIPAGGGGAPGNQATSLVPADWAMEDESVSPPTVVDAPYAMLAGAELSSTMGNWTGEPSSYAYQWKSNGVNVAGATMANYTTGPGDAGNSFTCAVTASNVAGQATSTSNAVVVGGGATGATGAAAR